MAVPWLSVFGDVGRVKDLFSTAVTVIALACFIFVVSGRVFICHHFHRHLIVGTKPQLPNCLSTCHVKGYYVFCLLKKLFHSRVKAVLFFTSHRY